VKYARLIAVYVAATLATVGLGQMALNAFEYEQRRFDSEANLLNEYLTQPPMGCEVFDETCLDEQGGWHFEAP
jgi:hypothetical protein